MKAIAPVATPVLVELTDGQPTTTSLDVAAHFGKRHDTVLRAIRQLECSSVFALHNFAECSRPGSNNKPEPFFRMTRDGFTFLCMGFTGKEAAKWKEEYICAFNQLEQQVRNIGLPQLHYPIARWLAFGPQRPLVRGEAPGLFVTPDMFADLPSPSLALLAELEAVGFNVDACSIEVRALRTHLDNARDQLRRIRDLAGDSLHIGVRLQAPSDKC